MELKVKELEIKKNFRCLLFLSIIGEMFKFFGSSFFDGPILIDRPFFDFMLFVLSHFVSTEPHHFNKFLYCRCRLFADLMFVLVFNGVVCYSYTNHPVTKCNIICNHNVTIQ